MPRFSLPKLRSRGRSVDSRQAAQPTQNYRALKQNAGARSVSVPPQRGHKSAASKGSVSTASKSTARESSVTGTRSVATTKTSSYGSSNSRAAGMSYSYSYDGDALPSNSRGQGNGQTTYTFADDAPAQKQRSSFGYESDGNTSTETSDEFITSLDRSPPNLGDMLLEEGAFGKVNNSGAQSNQNRADKELADSPDVIPSLEDDEPETFQANGSVFSTDTQLTDPSAAFQEWAVFGTDVKSNAAQQTLDAHSKPVNQISQPSDSTPVAPEASEWDSPQWRYTKNPRLVSPSPSSKVKLKNGGWDDSFGQGQNDDLSAWGMASPAVVSPQSKTTSTNEAFTDQNKSTSNSSFGVDFFSGGFDSGFDHDNDAFFGGDWTDVNDTNKSNKRANDSDDMMWEASPKFFEEKKDDQVFHSPALSAKSGLKGSSASQSSAAVPVTPADSALSLGTTAMDSKQDVVVSFDAFQTLNPTVSSSSSSRKVPPAPTMTSGHTSATGSTRRGHRRVPSNESSASKQFQRSQSRSRRGGGSVGSNSSAVDQILESYRQKRLAKQQQQGGWAASQNGNHLPPNSHKRSPSNESLSRTIGHLENSIAAHNQHGNIGSGAPTRPPQQSPQHQQFNQSPRPSPGGASPQSSIGFRTVSNSNYQPNLNAAVNEISDRLRVHRRELNAPNNEMSPLSPSSDSDQFLLANLEATIGPCGVAPDMESLSGRSNFHGRSSPRSMMHKSRGDASVDSRTSRNSFRSYRSNISQSALSQMSKESQSVANDLFRLEAQLAEVAMQQEQPLEVTTEESFSNIVTGSTSECSMRSNLGNTIIGAEPAPRPSLVEVVAPPGKLGILLANKVGTQGPTHVSAVRSESVLAGKVHVGDRFVSIDGEDVSGMNSREITSVMSKKADFERVIVFVPVQVGNRAQDWI